MARHARRNGWVEMTRAVSFSHFDSEFDDFLFASIGEDGNGMLLSVLSALARLDVDPWQEAAKLARLPWNTATQRLASLIAVLPDGPSAHRDPGTIAVRLITLLPRRRSSYLASRPTSLGVGAKTKFRAAARTVICAIFTSFILAAPCIIAHRHPPAQVDNAHAPASRAVSPNMVGDFDQQSQKANAYWPA
jgi:hypothetical protein